MIVSISNSKEMQRRRSLFRRHLSLGSESKIFSVELIHLVMFTSVLSIDRNVCS